MQVASAMSKRLEVEGITSISRRQVSFMERVKRRERCEMR